MLHVRLRFLASLALASCLVACATTPPTPEELVSTGFRDAEQTFRTFQSAVGADLVDLEYRCYGDDFKREWQLTQGNYRVAREELFERMPWIRRISRARIVATTVLDPGLVQLDVRVEFLFQTLDLEVFVAREEFYEVWVGNERIADGVLDFHGAVRRVSEGEGFEAVEQIVAQIELESPVPPNVARRLDEISEVRLGREWRIAGMRVRADE